MEITRMEVNALPGREEAVGIIGGGMFLHKKPLGLGQAPYGSELLLEICFAPGRVKFPERSSAPGTAAPSPRVTPSGSQTWDSQDARCLWLRVPSDRGSASVATLEERRHISGERRRPSHVGQPGKKQLPYPSTQRFPGGRARPSSFPALQQL